MLRVPAAAQATAVAGQIGETHVCPTIVGICGRTIEHFEGARCAGQVHAVDEQHERPHEFRSVEFVRFAVHEAAVVALVPAEGQSEKHHDARSDQQRGVVLHFVSKHPRQQTFGGRNVQLQGHQSKGV